eukprot:6477867-Prymnesium_polylepis.1
MGGREAHRRTSRRQGRPAKGPILSGPFHRARAAIAPPAHYRDEGAFVSAGVRRGAMHEPLPARE